MKNKFFAVSIVALALFALPAYAITFAPPALYDQGGEAPKKILQGDFNQDGLMDAVMTTGAHSSQFNINLGDGQGGLLNEKTYQLEAASGLASGDFNNDGVLDLAVTQDVTYPFYTYMPGTHVYLGTGTGSFQPSAILIGGRGPSAVTSSDMNNDGNQDLLVVSDAGLHLFSGMGNGTFSAGTLLKSWALYGVATADLNQDGYQDIVTTDNSGGSILYGSVNGSFTQAGAGGFTNFVLIDINKDTLVDIVSTNSYGYLQVKLNSTSGFLQENYAPIPVLYDSNLAVRDMDNDGNLDAVILNNNNEVVVYHGDGNGSWVTETAIPLPPYDPNSQPRQLALGDWNYDEYSDILITKSDDQMWIINQSTGGTLPPPPPAPTPDTQIPVATFTNPTDGSTISGIVSLDVVATDNNEVTEVVFYVDDSYVGFAEWSEVTSFSFDSSELLPGEHTITATAYDDDGNIGYATITVNVQ